MTRILVIDSDREFCRLLGEYLIGEGMTAEFAHDGKLGVSSALSGRYDVVVLDAASAKSEWISSHQATAGKFWSRLIDLNYSRRRSGWDYWFGVRR
jgi:DNA-binding NtrC family response regulator